MSSDISTSLVNIDQYNFVRVDRVGRGGGVGVYIRCGLDFEILLWESSSHLEHLWLKMKVGGKNIVVGSPYRPPNGSIPEFFDKIEDSISNFYSFGQDVVCGGDVNIDFLDLNMTQGQ